MVFLALIYIAGYLLFHKSVIVDSGINDILIITGAVLILLLLIITPIIWKIYSNSKLIKIITTAEPETVKSEILKLYLKFLSTTYIVMDIVVILSIIISILDIEKGDALEIAFGTVALFIMMMIITAPKRITDKKNCDMLEYAKSKWDS